MPDNINALVGRDDFACFCIHIKIILPRRKEEKRDLVRWQGANFEFQITIKCLEGDECFVSG